MKNTITFLMCTLCILTGMAQSDLSGDQLVIPEKTPALEALYHQGRALEQNGTAAEINANRLAIKDAWQAIDPNVAALYKPIETPSSSKIGGDGSYRSTTIKNRPEQSRAPEDWDTDRLLRYDYIDGLDMDVTSGGNIYIAAFENYVGSGSDSNLYIYRSIDGGNSFILWQEQPVIDSYFSKIQTITMDGSGDNYLLVYSLFENGTFQAFRWNMATGYFHFQTIGTNVGDFGVDRNYPLDTSSQRVFATYQKSNHSTYSARSTAGSYGFDWIDETSFGILGEQVAFAYGRDGGCYTTFIGYNSRSLRAKTNSDFNDPTSWGANETVQDGAITETLNPTIRAPRKDLATNEFLILASTRAAGTTGSYKSQAYKKINGTTYFGIGYVETGPNQNITHIDSWIRRSNDVETIQTSWIYEQIDGSVDNANFSMIYNGTGFDIYQPVSDTGIDVFEGFPSAIAETKDELPCMAFAGTDVSGGFGYGLYFDAKTVLSVAENSFEGFKYYPNPAQNVLNLSAKSTIESVSIFSLLGQKVMETSVNQATSSINIASLTQGVYLMKVMIDGKSATYKIIKQ